MPSATRGIEKGGNVAIVAAIGAGDAAFSAVDDIERGITGPYAGVVRRGRRGRKPPRRYGFDWSPGSAVINLFHDGIFIRREQISFHLFVGSWFSVHAPRRSMRSILCIPRRIRRRQPYQIPPIHSIRLGTT